MGDHILSLDPCMVLLCMYMLIYNSLTGVLRLNDKMLFAKFDLSDSKVPLSIYVFGFVLSSISSFNIIKNPALTRFAIKEIKKQLWENILREAFYVKMKI